MNIEAPEFDEYERRFRELAEEADEPEPADKPTLTDTQLFLCLYGENGLSVADELDLLAKLEATPKEKLEKLEVDTDYWQDTVLFVRY